MNRFAWMLALAPGFLTPALAEGVKIADLLPATPGARACFARTYDAAHLRAHPHQRVTAVTFLMRTTGFDKKGEWVLTPDGKAEYTRTLFGIRFARRDLRKPQTTSGECAQGESEAHCYVECDGGGVVLEKSGEGLLLKLLDQGIRIEDCDEKDVRLMPGRDDKAFRVDKVDGAQCRALEKATLGR